MRTDLPGLPGVHAVAENVSGVLRGTTISSDGVNIHTVEHVLAAIRGCGVDNVLVEIDSNEPPVGDGSALAYVRMIQSAGIEEQDEAREELVLDRAVGSQKIMLP